MITGPQGTVNMVLFTGRCDCDFFHGEILPGGVDTQMYLRGEPGRLSARYMLRGTDAEGRRTHIFIENNGVHGADTPTVTTPYILTDNEHLAWLTQEKLTGRLEVHEGGVRILFYREGEA